MKPAYWQTVAWALLGALLIATGLCAAEAYAGEVTALAGVSQFTPQNDGTWWQEPFEHTLNMRSPSFGLRYDTEQNDSGWSLGAGYMNLGRVSSSALAVALDGKAPGDGGYNSATKACNGPCWPLSHWYGHGKVDGLFGVVSKHYGPWSVEGGFYLYYPTWCVDVLDWIGTRNDTPHAITACHRNHWQPGPMFGVRYKPSDWSLNFSIWQTQSQGDSYVSLYHGATYNLSVGYSF